MWHQTQTILLTIKSPLSPQFATGDDGSQRNGFKIQAKKLTLRMKVAVDPNSDATNANIVANAHIFRVILYVDVASNGTAPTWDQLIETNPTNEGQEYAYNKLSSTGRFKILMDKWVTVPPSYVVHDGAAFHAYGNNKFFKRLFHWTLPFTTLMLLTILLQFKETTLECSLPQMHQLAATLI